MRLRALESTKVPTRAAVKAGEEFSIDDAVGDDLLKMHPNLFAKAPEPDPEPTAEPEKAKAVKPKDQPAPVEVKG